MSDGPTGTVPPDGPPTAADGTFAQPSGAASVPREGAVVDPTGDERVDAALRRLAELPDVPTSGHVEIFEDVHRRLQDVLASVGEQAPAPGPPPPGGRP